MGLLKLNCLILKLEFWVRQRYLDGEDGSFIAVLSAVVWGREYCIHHWDALPLRPPMLLVAFNLYLMCPDHGHVFVFFEEFAAVFCAEEDRAVALVVTNVRLIVGDAPVFLLHWV